MDFEQVLWHETRLCKARLCHLYDIVVPKIYESHIFWDGMKVLE